MNKFLLALTLGTQVLISPTLPTCATCALTSAKLSQFASTTSAEFAGVISDETGTGLVVLGTSPTIATPIITLTPVLTANLPTCNAGNNNRLEIVSDALLPALGVALTGAGALTVGVICISGTGWIVY